MPLNYTFHPDERPASLLVDDTDSWWSGAQYGFVRVPIALALAATALSVSLAFGYQQQTDEIVPQPAVTIVEDDHWQQPWTVRAATYVQPWADDDLPVTPAAPLQVEEAYWWTPYSLPATLCATLYVVDDEIVVAPESEYALDAGAWTLQALPPAKRAVMVF